MVLAWLDLGLWSDSSQSLKFEREYRLHEAEVTIESFPIYVCHLQLYPANNNLETNRVHFKRLIREGLKKIWLKPSLSDP